MADSVAPDDVDEFVSNSSWAICSTYHTVLKSSPGAAVFSCYILFGIPYLADWQKIGIRRQTYPTTMKLARMLVGWIIIMWLANKY